MKAFGVMFDWDGVLIDSLGASFNVYSKIFARLGARRLTKDEFLMVQSPNWYEFYIKVGISKKLWKEIDDEWVRLYKEERPDLHPDSLECLSTLKRSGFRLGLVSNGSKARIEEELDRFKLGPFFDSTVFGVRKEELKPSPFMLEKTLKVLGLPAKNAVYVGDSPADMQAAKNAGVPSIALARGPIQRKRLRAESPDHIFGGLNELTNFLVAGM
jgi:HAD superfamily hydrolase (TIGR01549 family)